MGLSLPHNRPDNNQNFRHAPWAFPVFFPDIVPQNASCGRGPNDTVFNRARGHAAKPSGIALPALTSACHP